MSERDPAEDAALADARAKLADYLHHDEADCDQAAQRLSHSPRREDRMIAAEWLQLRAREAQR